MLEKLDIKLTKSEDYVVMFHMGTDKFKLLDSSINVTTELTNEKLIGMLNHYVNCWDYDVEHCDINVTTSDNTKHYMMYKLRDNYVLDTLYSYDEEESPILVDTMHAKDMFVILNYITDLIEEK